MSVSGQVREYFAEDDRVAHVIGIRSTLYGQDAISISVTLKDRRKVTGTFTTETKPGFGGVDFSQKKNPAALMIAKVNSVLAGTHDRT